VSAILIFSAIMLVLVLIGSPLLTIMGGATLLLFAIFMPEYRDVENLLIVIQKSEDLFTKQEFLAIPLFTISGAIMTAGGIAKRLIAVAEAAFGWLPGGMAVAAIVACMLFGSITGSSPVTLIAIGSIMFPALVRAGYPENFALGLLTTAGSLGCLVPPSQAMLFYSLSTTGSPAAVAPEDMFLGGMLPALFMAGLLMVYAIFKGLKVDEQRPRFTVRALLHAIRDGIWALLLPGVVLGGIYGGFFTPSEAGGPAGIYAIVVTMVIYRELNFEGLKKALVDTAGLMGSLLPIIALSFGLNEFIALAEVKDSLEAWLIAKQFGPLRVPVHGEHLPDRHRGVDGLDQLHADLRADAGADRLETLRHRSGALRRGLRGEHGDRLSDAARGDQPVRICRGVPQTLRTGHARRVADPRSHVHRPLRPHVRADAQQSRAELEERRGHLRGVPLERSAGRPGRRCADRGRLARRHCAGFLPQGTVPAPTSEGGALDISDLTAKSMEGFDDEPASAPPSAAASAPASDSGKVLDLNDLTQKAMDGFDDAAPASQAPSAP
jgi:tripartite ATP-independent transporter DctM subunit